MMTTQLSPSMRQLIRGLQAFQRARKLQLGCLTVAWTFVAISFLLLLSVAADMILKFPSEGRWTAAALIMAVGLAGLVLLLKILLLHSSLQSLAILAERAQPQVSNAYINAVQLQQSTPEAGSYIEGILSETTVKPSQISASHTYSPLLLKRLPYALLPILAAFSCLAWLAPERCAISLRRILQPQAPIAPYSETFIDTLSPCTLTIKRGKEFTVHVSLKGVIPQQAEIQWNVPATKAQNQQPMLPQIDQPQSFSFTFPPVFDDLTYRVVANDAESPWYDVYVDNPPGLGNWEMTITPPDYTGLKPYGFTAASESREIIAGSKVIFAGAASRKLLKASFNANNKHLATIHQQEPFSTFICRAVAPVSGTLSTSLQTPSGMTATVNLPVVIIPDKTPVVTLYNTPTALKINREDSFAVTFVATDDYGLDSVSIVQLKADEQPETVAVAMPKPEQRKLFQGRFIVDAKTFSAKTQTLRFRLHAHEAASSHPTRIGRSPVISVSFFTPQEAAENSQRKAKDTEATLEKMLILQRNTLKRTNELLLKNTQGKRLEPSSIAALFTSQKTIRDMGISLLSNRGMMGMAGDVLAGMVNKELTDVLTAIDRLNQIDGARAVIPLQGVAVIQTRIIALLTNMNHKMLNSEEKHRGRTDVFDAIQRLVKDQNIIIKLTREAQKQKKDAVDYQRLTDLQIQISKTILHFNDLALKIAEEHAEDDFSIQLRKALQAMEKHQTYTHSMEAADCLDAEELKEAEDGEKKALKGLAEAYAILNQWRINHAKKTVECAKKTLTKVNEALKGMERTQAKIAEIAKELQKRGLTKDDPKLKDDMEKLEKEHEKMLDLLEELANDLYQFPDLPVCNELNTKMREIFEDVLQAKDSEKLKAVEIAVQKEDAILDAIRSTTERIDDVEMWLPDVPDHFVWNMESFDADEFPEMPLVDLPEELQDIVGELLEQDADIDAQSQDTTGNNMIADTEMGWAVMDGPMPSFSAKGKSGNTRPNDNEMTGRSGSGREGQSTGELVENHVKGYEGRKTHARKTNDKFQQGQVTEDEDSTMDARSTGGGKLGGDSESIGMFGNTIRRDLHRGDHGKTPQQLRQETDVLYAKARLLYVNSGSLGEVAHHLNTFGGKQPDLKSFDRVKKKVYRRLTDSVIEMKEGTVLHMPVDPVLKHHANEAEQRKGEAVSEEYQHQLNDYFKSLSH